MLADIFDGVASSRRYKNIDKAEQNHGAVLR